MEGKYFNLLDFFMREDKLYLFFESMGLYNIAQSNNHMNFFPEEALIVIDNYCSNGNKDYMQYHLKKLLRTWMKTNDGLLKSYLTIASLKKLSKKGVIKQDLIPKWMFKKVSDTIIKKLDSLKGCKSELCESEPLGIYGYVLKQEYFCRQIWGFNILDDKEIVL